MESMRSLNTSLPRASHEKRSPQSQDQLIQAFKTAALSVTNLYKNAATNEKRVRDDGYQQALDDLLTFLDRRNIGLDDGEGWAVRQWATERLDNSPITAGSDSDEDKAEDDKRARSSSPVQKNHVERNRRAKSNSPTASNLHSLNTSIATGQHDSRLEHPESFTFRSAMPYPHDTAMQLSEVTTGCPPLPTSYIQAAGSTPTGVRVEVVPRGTRTPHRTSTHMSRHSTRSIPSSRISSTSSGSKRKIAFGDYFDLGSLGDPKDGPGGGGKRGRFA